VPARLRFVVAPPEPIPESTGTWVDVTPAGASSALSSAVNNDRYGFNGALAHPGDGLKGWAFIDRGGCWRTTNAGSSYARMDSPNSTVSPCADGKNWGPAISPDGSRLFNCSGNNFNSIGGKEVRFTVQWSDDDGATWSLSNVLPGVPYAVAQCQQDAKLLLATDHDTNALFMSTNGGSSWSAKGSHPGAESAYVQWVTSTSALLIGQAGSSAGLSLGSYDPSGTGTWTWTPVSTHQHSHGVWQPLMNSTFVFVPGTAGIIRAPLGDLSSWTSVEGSIRDCIWGNPTNLFSARSFPVGNSSYSPEFRSSTQTAGTVWGSASNPAGITNGPRMAVTLRNRAGQYVSVGANWNHGLMRRVEG
jgi:hypothetical protein